MYKPVPEQINHRRRVLHAALRQALRDPARADTIFKICDPLVREEHFVASRVTAWVSDTGLISHEEQVALTRALLQAMRLPYEELPKFPDHLVVPTQNGQITQARVQASAAARRGAPGAQAAAAAQAVSEPPAQARATKFATVLDLDAAASHPQTAAKAGLLHNLLGLFRPKPQAAPGYRSRPEARVFRMVVSGLLEPLQRQDPYFERSLLEVARQSEHRGLVGPILEPWVGAGLAPPALPGNLTLPQMRAVVNLLYLCACQALGGEAADRLLEAAVAQAAPMSDARQFPPQKLI